MNKEAFYDSGTEQNIAKYPQSNIDENAEDENMVHIAQPSNDRGCSLTYLGLKKEGKWCTIYWSFIYNAIILCCLV